MSFLKRLFKFYIDASIHLGLMAYALTRITELYLQLPYQEALDYLVFYGTILAYNFVKYAEVSKLYHRNLTTALKSIQILSGVSLVLVFYYASKLTWQTLLFFIPFGVLTVLYAIPFFSGFRKNLRNISFIKNSVIALVWAGVTVLIPAINAQKSIDTTIVLLFLQRFILIIVLMIPFDIRDVAFDKTSLKTLPQQIGIEKTKKIGYLLLMFSMLIEFLVAPNQSFRNAFLILFFVLIFLLMRAKNPQKKYYSSFFVDGVAVFWWIILLLILKN